ncbi:MAG: hypothetical protein OEQ53_05815, partial [Saprospiraceae bacterium]|nr:hypothetical protein [Saprospiraceae bacterium]
MQSSSQRFLSLYFPLLFFALSLQAQIDTEFWFAAPSVSVGHGDRPIMLRLTTFESAAHIIISQPANPLFNPIEIDVSAHASRTVDLSWHIDRVENWPGYQVLDR